MIYSESLGFPILALGEIKARLNAFNAAQNAWYQRASIDLGYARLASQKQIAAQQAATQQAIAQLNAQTALQKAQLQSQTQKDIASQQAQTQLDIAQMQLQAKQQEEQALANAFAKAYQALYGGKEQPEQTAQKEQEPRHYSGGFVTAYYPDGSTKTIEVPPS